MKLIYQINCDNRGFNGFKINEFGQPCSEKWSCILFRYNYSDYTELPYDHKKYKIDELPKFD